MVSKEQASTPQFPRINPQSFSRPRTYRGNRIIRVPNISYSNLYSVGEGADGKLGHGDTKDKTQPKIIDYFDKHNIKVKDAVAG